MVGRFSNAYGTTTTQRSIIVRMTALDGTAGLGNIDPLPGYSSETVDKSLKALRTTFVPAILGYDAANPHGVVARLNEVLPGFRDAKASVEMACVDLTAHSLGIPVHSYLGGAIRTTVTFNGWIGIVPPEIAAAEARQWTERGFQSMKVKAGGGVRADVERLRAVREAVGSRVRLRVDANGGYSVDESIELGRALEPCNPQLLEQPVAPEDLAGLARVRGKIGIPIMADEAVTDHESLIRVIRADCADIVKLKLMKQGGFLATRRMVETAAAAGLKVIIGHGFGLSINTAAEISLAATSDAVLDGLECVGPLKMHDDVVHERVDISSGAMVINARAGLGITLDDTKIARYEFAGEVQPERATSE